MGNLEWQERFSVHVQEMDRHHKKLLEYFAELEKEMQSSNAERQSGVILKALADYAEFHFAEEERLMRSMNYPELASHLNQHLYFTDQVREMFEQLQSGMLPPQSLLSFLKDWFVNHILMEDKKYGEMMKQGNPLS
jgi:hemerythrin